ncbi:hypothetical protein [Nocardiopsis algeriensis]|uniref:Uncharacterized protein n=1 Tax=Nocardiopsis algeriensis TaxID=1478215 RepID=A0A841IWB9_9ACTN|nr:hypothetical protein [Nocardiopsis algeriensis]MBB6121576.1 hypothetical protein [Nocardiopsis algeriensis]
MGLIDSMWKKGTVDSRSSDGSKDVAASNGDSGKRARRRKPEEMLASVVRESTVNAAIDLLSRNDPFVLPGRNSWVVLALPVENIGGLSKKQQRDEAKGSLIELINHDHIQTITTRQLLDEEVLGIIPTPQTLERMGEYSLLTGTTYYWMILGPSQDRQELLVNAVIDEPVSYTEAVSISSGDRSLADRLPQVWAWTQAIETTATSVDTEDSADADAFDDAVATAPQPASATEGEDVPPAGPEAAMPAQDEDIDRHELEDDSPAVGESAATTFDEEPSEDVASSVPENLDGDGTGGLEHEDEDFTTGSAQEPAPPWRDYAEQHQEQEFTEEQVRLTIARRFLPDDLDLEIPLADFEATFGTGARPVRLEFSDNSSDWLGEQVALMAGQANAELEKLHRDHRKDLRQFFVETMSLHAESVMREVDERREGTVYHMLSKAAEEEFAELRSRAHEEVSAQRAEITRRYEKDASERAEVAAAQARQAFWDRFRPELERKIADVAPEIERRNEERYAHQRQLVLEMRRKDAHTRMQLGTTRALRLLSEREAAQREAEMELLKQWNAKVTRFIDDNRKHDIVRAKALSEQLRLDNRIEEMQAEHSARVKELKAEQEDQARKLGAELERDRERAEARLREREGEWKHEIDIRDEKLRSAHQLYTDLQAQMQDMADSMHRQYRSRIEELEGDKRSYAEELNRTNRVHSRFNKLLLVLAAVLVLISIAVGVILGWTIGYGSAGTAVSAMAVPVRSV